MTIPINYLRRFQFIEDVIPGRFRLPFRYRCQHFFGALEPEMMFIPYFVNNSCIAIDVGANKGIYAYLLAKYAKHVYCFEPIAELCDYINNYASDKITVHNTALSDTSGHMTLTIPVDSGRKVTTRASLVPAPTGEKRDVLVKTLDSYGYEDVGFMKIDVEGVEEKVIAGAINTIMKYKPVLLVEFFYDYFKYDRCLSLFNYLVGLGYSPAIADKKKLATCSTRLFENKELARNIIFLPHDHPLCLSL